MLQIAATITTTLIAQQFSNKCPHNNSATQLNAFSTNNKTTQLHCSKTQQELENLSKTHTHRANADVKFTHKIRRLSTVVRQRHLLFNSLPWNLRLFVHIAPRHLWNNESV